MRFRTAAAGCIMFFLMLAQYSNAQTGGKFVPLTDDAKLKADIAKSIRTRNLADSLAVTGENKKYIRSFYRDRYEFVEDMFTENEVFAAPEAHAYLQTLVDRIFAANPQLDRRGMNFLFSRAPWPNAASVGDGTVFFNISLFEKLHNEAEVVFVLCHELAHYFSDHSNRAFNQYLSTTLGEEMQSRLREISKMRYEQNKELKGLAQAFVYKSRRHSREHESEADSIGLTYLKNTGYALRFADSALMALDGADKMRYDCEPHLPVVFSSASFAFQPKWLKKETAFFGGITDTLSKKEKDSLKTHPDCVLRARRLTPAINAGTSGGTAFKGSESAFYDWQRRFRLEGIEYCFNSENQSLALYRALELLRDEPNNLYAVTMIGKCFNSFYSRQKEHRLNQVISLPSPYVDKNYNRLLEFLSKIRLNDISALGYSFLSNYSARFGTDPEFAKVFSESAANFKQ